MKNAPSLVLSIALLAASMLLSLTWDVSPNAQASQANAEPPYHHHPPNGPLPETLDPRQFAGNQSAFVCYTLAAEMKSILYQVPCYCGCVKEQGHQSLLDCFISKHGGSCRLCQQEVLFCYRERSAGKRPAKIRAELDWGKASELDLQEYVNRLYLEIQHGSHEK